MSALDKFLAGLTDDLWLTGTDLKALVAALIEDRAVLAPGCGDELPTPSGRQLRPLGSSGAIPAILVVKGKLRKATLAGTLAADDDDDDDDDS